MKIPKKYLYESGTNKGKLNQTALQVELKTNDRGQPHPKVKGLVLIRIKNDSLNTQRWGTVEQHQNRRKKDREWNLNNPELKTANSKRYKKRHLGRVREAVRKNHAKRRENGKCKAHRLTAKYRERHRENQRRYRESNLFLVATRSRYGKLIPRLDRHWDVDELLGADDVTVRKNFELKFKDGMSWDNHGEWHIDHIIPCAFFDLTKPSHQKVCFNYQNLQPMWASENCSKQDKIHWSIVLTLMMNNYKTIGLN